MLTYIETCQLEIKNRSYWPIWFPKDLLTGIYPKSTPGHGNCIPLPTPFERSEVGNFHHLIEDGGLENKSTGLENINFPIWYAMCFWEGHGWSPDHPDWLPLSLILVWDLKLCRNRICPCQSVQWCEILYKIYSENVWEKGQEKSLKLLC